MQQIHEIEDRHQKRISATVQSPNDVALEKKLQSVDEMVNYNEQYAGQNFHYYYNPELPSKMSKATTTQINTLSYPMLVTMNDLNTLQSTLVGGQSTTNDNEAFGRHFSLKNVSSPNINSKEKVLQWLEKCHKQSCTSQSKQEKACLLYTSPSPRD